jgi:hydrogenase-1 operon protein HyaE
MALHPLLTRLAALTDAVVIAPDTVEAFESAAGAAVLFFSGDPVRFPEALDVAVVLPELHAVNGRSFRVGIVPRECEDPIARRWGVQRWPSLVFLRDGEYLATLSRMKDWEPFVAEVRDALAARPSRRPTVGIPVVGATPGTSCG